MKTDLKLPEMKMPDLTGHDLDLLEIKPPEESRLVFPVLLVGLGGTGAEVLRRIKPQLERLGLKDFVRFLVVDLDASSREPQGHLPGFKDDEFCFLSREPMRNVFRSPDYHPELVRRLGLGDDDGTRMLRSIAERDGAGAGQVRPLGLLSLYGSLDVFHAHLENAISELARRWGVLEKRLAADSTTRLRMQKNFYVIVVGSICGGTGSSCLIDVGVMLRNKIRDREPTISAFLTLPDVYREVVQGRDLEFQRMKANAYATLLELDYFQTGKARDRRDLLPANSMHMDLNVPPSLFDFTYLIERTDAVGRDLMSMRAVYDTIALHITADIGSTIGGKFRLGEANDAVKAGLATCPKTRRPRLYSTMGATAAAIPVRRLLNYCACKQCYDFVETDLLAPADAKVVEADLNQWLASVQLTERAITDRVLSADVFDKDSLLNQLYASASMSNREYLNNETFKSRCREIWQCWKGTELPHLRQRTAGRSQPLIEELQKKIEEKNEKTHSQHGCRYQAAFLQQLGAALKAHPGAPSPGTGTGAGQESDDWLEPVLKELDGGINILNRPKKSIQEKAVLTIRQQLEAAQQSELRQVPAQVLATLQQRVEELYLGALAAIEQCENVKKYFNEHAHTNRTPAVAPGVHATVTTGDSDAEIDVTTPEFFQDFYAKNLLPGNEMVSKLAGGAKKWVYPVGGIRERETMQRMLFGVAHAHFQESAKELTIGKVLQHHLQNAALNGKANVRLTEAIKACHPLWRAQIGVMGTRFSDTIIVGRPAEMAKEVNDHLDEVVLLTQKSLNEDPLYQAQIDVTSTHDPHRVYAVRRSHGGMPFYLLSWSMYRKAYETWISSGAHPIHIFSPDVVQSMPLIEPSQTLSGAGRAFALAMAFGWVAQRGSWFYQNLRDGTGVWQMLTYSDWDCVAYRNRARRPDLGSLQRLIERNLLSIDLGDLQESLRLSPAEGRERALEELENRPQIVQDIDSVFKRLCMEAGNTTVARDLENYVEEVYRRIQSSSPLRSQLRREADILQHEIEKLRHNG